MLKQIKKDHNPFGSNRHTNRTICSTLWHIHNVNNFFLPTNNIQLKINKTIKIFFQPNIKDISEDTLTEEQLQALTILKNYIPKEEAVKKIN